MIEEIVLNGLDLKTSKVNCIIAMFIYVLYVLRISDYFKLYMHWVSWQYILNAFQVLFFYNKN